MRKTALHGVEQLILAQARRCRFVFKLRLGRIALDIGYGVGGAGLADQQAVALREVARAAGPGVGRDQAAIGVRRLARRHALGDDARLGVLAEMYHLGAGIGLLRPIGDRDRVELADAVIATQDARRIFPGHGRAGFNLRP